MTWSKYVVSSVVNELEPVVKNKMSLSVMEYEEGLQLRVAVIMQVFYIPELPYRAHTAQSVPCNSVHIALYSMIYMLLKVAICHV